MSRHGHLTLDVSRLTALEAQFVPRRACRRRARRRRSPGHARPPPCRSVWLAQAAVPCSLMAVSNAGGTTMTATGGPTAIPALRPSSFAPSITRKRPSTARTRGVPCCPANKWRAGRTRRWSGHAAEHHTCDREGRQPRHWRGRQRRRATVRPVDRERVVLGRTTMTGSSARVP